LQERQQFLIRVRGLAHAPDGVEIFQRIHARHRRFGHERDVPGERGAMRGEFVMLKRQSREQDCNRRDGGARQKCVPVENEIPFARAARFFQFDRLQNARGEIRRNGRVGQARKQFAQFILERIVFHCLLLIKNRCGNKVARENPLAAAWISAYSAGEK